MVIGSLSTFGNRYTFILVVALFASIFICLTPSIWFSAPWGMSLSNLFYYVVGWMLAGIVIAKMVKPKDPATA